MQSSFDEFRGVLYMYIMYCDKKFWCKMLNINFEKKTTNKLILEKETKMQIRTWSDFQTLIKHLRIFFSQADHSMLPHLFPKLFFPPTRIKHQRLLNPITFT